MGGHEQCCSSAEKIAQPPALCRQACVGGMSTHALVWPLPGWGSRWVSSFMARATRHLCQRRSPLFAHLQLPQQAGAELEARRAGGDWSTGSSGHAGGSDGGSGGMQAAAAAAPRSGRQGLPDALKMLPMRLQEAAVAAAGQGSMLEQLGCMEAAWSLGCSRQALPASADLLARSTRALARPAAAQAASAGLAAVGRLLGNRGAAAGWPLH